MDIIFLSVALSMYLIFISMISGDYGVAAFSSGQRLYFFAIMPLSAIGTAVTAVTGSAFEAKNREYLSRSHIYGSKISIAFGTALTVIFVVFASPLATIFAYTAETSVLIPEIANFLQIATLCLPLTGAGMASSYFYQGIGQGEHKFNLDNCKGNSMYKLPDIPVRNPFGMGFNRCLAGSCGWQGSGRWTELCICQTHHKKYQERF